MVFIEFLAAIGRRLPTVERPKIRLPLGRRLVWTGIALLIYFIMANTPIYGVRTSEADPFRGLYLLQVIFASNLGTLMELGIGPIVTAGLILQILVGAKIIKLDLTNPEDRRKFTEADKALALIIALIEASIYAFVWRWDPKLMYMIPLHIKLIVIIQLFIATFVVILLDEMIQKGWGLGSGVSLFILAGVVYNVFWSLLGPLMVRGEEPYGFIPYTIWVFMNGKDPSSIILRYRIDIRSGLPDLIGFITTFTLIAILVYLEGMKVEIPVTTQRLRGIRTRVPLKFIYVTNIPVLLVGILISDLQLFLRLAERLGPGPVADAFRLIIVYLSPPRSIIVALYDPMRVLISCLAWVGLAILLGFMWVEIAGLSPAQQAENLIKSGLEIPGMRRNPKILERLLAKYIHPLTILSSIIVALIAVFASILGAYGSGTGLLLAVGIVYQYYMMIAYERTLEMYPVLKRIIGEE